MYKPHFRTFLLRSNVNASWSGPGFSSSQKKQTSFAPTTLQQVTLRYQSHVASLLALAGAVELPIAGLVPFGMIFQHSSFHTTTTTFIWTSEVDWHGLL